MPVKTQVYNQKGEKTEELSLADNIFKVELNKDLVHQAFVTQRANERQVLAHTKGRGEVRGGGRKPWRQKGTGRARVGSSRSPIWIGGGVTFGPTKERNFSRQINKKMKQKAIFMALSDKVNNANIYVVDNFKLEEFKTKAIAELISKVTADKKTEDKKRSVLIIIDKKDEKIKYSGRNLVGAGIITLNNINILDLLKYRDLIITKEAVVQLEKIYPNTKLNK